MLSAGYNKQSVYSITLLLPIPLQGKLYLQCKVIYKQATPSLTSLYYYIYNLYKAY